MAKKDPNNVVCFVDFRGVNGGVDCIRIEGHKKGEAKVIAREIRIREGKPAKIIRAQQVREGKH